MLGVGDSRGENPRSNPSFCLQFAMVWAEAEEKVRSRSSYYNDIDRQYNITYGPSTLQSKQLTVAKVNTTSNAATIGLNHLDIFISTIFLSSYSTLVLYVYRALTLSLF